MAFLGLFLEQKTAAGNTVLQWDCLHCNALVLVNHHLLCCVNVVEMQLIFQAVAEKIELCLHKALQQRVGIYMQWCCASKKAECGY